ncbi:hypothetical protein [Flavobacterium sp. 7A]|uniref:hypothetical protein n=1 Tax=Flavobacterium sp. 7A TaxID=2940571 RepID=UPI002225F1E2|nr:hypothetical protein [Flavobacterium sp. 7A]MCW2119586.1 hypothetical protein [Flavobacterium sp. 7A]
MRFTIFKKELVLASIIGVLGIGVYYFLNNENTDGSLGTFDDPELAFQETQKALSLMSAPLNLGMKSMLYVQKCESARTQIFIKQ